MEFDKINFSVMEGIAIISLNSPKNLNALDELLLDDFNEALEICCNDDDIKVVIITGEGNAFSAGGDIGGMIKAIKTGDMFLAPGVRKVSYTALKLRNLKKPVIASVNGAAAGAGFNLALLCDFRVAADNAKFVQAFVNIGLIPDMGGTFLLTKMIGAAKATELLMLGRPVSAEEALSLGLVTKVVTTEELEAETIKLAKKLCSLPVQSLSNIKSLINRAAFNGFETDLQNEIEYQIACGQTEDFKEGVFAFAEKRKANFTGK